MALRMSGLAAITLLVLLPGCAPQATPTTGSVGAVAPVAVATPERRFKNLAWNAAWAEVCGFHVDYPSLKGSYMAYEAVNGARAEDVAKFGASLDKARSLIQRVVASRADECDDKRLERIRASMARYVANDFSSIEAV